MKITLLNFFPYRISSKFWCNDLPLVLFILRITSEVLRDYSWVFSWWGLGGPYMVLGITSRLALCKISTLSALLLLQLMVCSFYSTLVCLGNLYTPASLVFSYSLSPLQSLPSHGCVIAKLIFLFLKVVSPELLLYSVWMRRNLQWGSATSIGAHLVRWCSQARCQDSPTLSIPMAAIWLPCGTPWTTLSWLSQLLQHYHVLCVMITQ